MTAGTYLGSIQRVVTLYREFPRYDPSTRDKCSVSLHVRAPVSLKDWITMRTYFESYFPLLLLMITVPIGHLTHVPAHIPNGCTSILKMKATYSSKMWLPSDHIMSHTEDSILHTLRVLGLWSILCALSTSQQMPACPLLHSMHWKAAGLHRQCATLWKQVESLQLL